MYGVNSDDSTKCLQRALGNYSSTFFSALDTQDRYGRGMPLMTKWLESRHLSDMK